MEIAVFYQQGTPGMEMSLAPPESRALIEAVAQRVLVLLDEGRIGEVSTLDEQIINCRGGMGLDITTFNPDGVARDLENYHAATGRVLDAAMDGRHNSRLKNKWKLDVRQRLGVGRTALKMAGTLRAVQAEQDLDIITAIDALGTFEGANPDANSSDIIPSCRRRQVDVPPVCNLTWRRQRRSYHRHNHHSD